MSHSTGVTDRLIGDNSPNLNTKSTTITPSTIMLLWSLQKSPMILIECSKWMWKAIKHLQKDDLNLRIIKQCKGLSTPEIWRQWFYVFATIAEIWVLSMSNSSLTDSRTLTISFALTRRTIKFIKHLKLNQLSMRRISVRINWSTPN